MSEHLDEAKVSLKEDAGEQKNSDELVDKLEAFIQMKLVVVTVICRCRMLLLARFSAAMTELSPCLQKCAAAGKDVKIDM